MSNRTIYIVLIGALLAFGFFTSRNLLKARADRQKKTCIENLADIEGAKEQYAIEHDGTGVASMTDLVPAYLDSLPRCPAGGTYTLGDLQLLVTCDVENHVLAW